MSDEAVGILGTALVIGAICGLIAGQIASKRDRSFGGFFLLGLLLGPIAIVVALLVTPGVPPAPSGMRPAICPRCNVRQNITIGVPQYTCWQCAAVVNTRAD